MTNTGPATATKFVVTAVYHEAAESPRDEGCMVNKTFVFEPTASIKDIFDSVYSSGDPIKSVVGRKPIQLLLSPDENSWGDERSEHYKNDKMAGIY